METKTAKLLQYIGEQNWKKALGIAQGFDRKFSKGDLRVIQIANECLGGMEDTYKQMDIDTVEMIKQSKVILTQYYTKLKS